MADEAQGVLAIWHDIRDGREADFEFWYRNEHFPERLGVPGFRMGRRFEAVSGAPHYFCYYLTETPDVLTSGAYIERLNHPTPLTRSMMSDAFLDMNRTVCREELYVGAGAPGKAGVPTAGAARLRISGSSGCAHRSRPSRPGCPRTPRSERSGCRPGRRPTRRPAPRPRARG